MWMFKVAQKLYRDTEQFKVAQFTIWTMAPVFQKLELLETGCHCPQFFIVWNFKHTIFLCFSVFWRRELLVHLRRPLLWYFEGIFIYTSYLFPMFAEAIHVKDIEQSNLQEKNQSWIMLSNLIYVRFVIYKAFNICAINATIGSVSL